MAKTISPVPPNAEARAAHASVAISPAISASPLGTRRRLMMRLALALGVIPLLAACHDDDDPPKKPSDARLKENITRIGKTLTGLPLYSFSYRGRSEVFAGVMAQDVLTVKPDAVLVSEDGYYAVDYGKLKLRMVQLQ